MLYRVCVWCTSIGLNTCKKTNIIKVVSIIISRADEIPVVDQSVNQPVLTLYTKYPCPLCDEAKEVLMHSPLWGRFILREVDIKLPENKKWFGLYRYEIPVFHLNGKFLMKHQVDLNFLEQHLSQKSIDVA